MTTAVKDLMQLFLKLYAGVISGEVRTEARIDYFQRDLVCTPYFGNYGKMAGWVICVNGSPPKGTLIVSAEGPDEVPTFFLGATAKRMPEKQEKVIQAFYKEHLKDKNATFVMKTKGVPRSTLA